MILGAFHPQDSARVLQSWSRIFKMFKNKTLKFEKVLVACKNVNNSKRHVTPEEHLISREQFFFGAVAGVKEKGTGTQFPLRNSCFRGCHSGNRCCLTHAHTGRSGFGLVAFGAAVESK